MHPEDELSSAAATGNTERVRLLLQNGANVNSINTFGRTPIQVMMMGSTPVAQLLLDHGADPNVSDESTGATPLHDTARLGFLETVRILVQHHADPNATDNRNCRPADLARENGFLDVAEFLDNV
ncbi:cyclin-dependent kinase 4 inhibitor B [Chanos chanos]|uniref:Cyclin-dependent kinase 4 inhibitor B n=1 Tax=Chanos chanos TaxID=29144 RepID=A0A6J2WK42_CHACN|nr:cyclin-dependent kinase 4 inhibitor B-like [Chanos chanos]